MSERRAPLQPNRCTSPVQQTNVQQLTDTSKVLIMLLLLIITIIIMTTTIIIVTYLHNIK